MIKNEQTKFHQHVWNYNYPNDFDIGFNDIQYLWNQTLMTKLNFINAVLYSAHMERNKTIVVPIKFKKLIESLEFYTADTDTITHYCIKFIDDDVDYFNVQGVPLKIENYIEPNIENYVYQS